MDFKYYTSILFFVVISSENTVYSNYKIIIRQYMGDLNIPIFSYFNYCYQSKGLL